MTPLRRHSLTILLEICTLASLATGIDSPPVYPHRLRLFREVQVVAEPLPPDDLLDREARVAVRQRQEEVPARGHQDKDDKGGDPRGQHALAGKALASSQVALGRDGLLTGLGSLVGHLVLDGVLAEDELDQGTRYEGRGQVGGKVVVQEQLTAHDVEGEVVGCPGEEKEARRVVQARARAWRSDMVSYGIA